MMVQDPLMDLCVILEHLTVNRVIATPGALLGPAPVERPAFFLHLILVGKEFRAIVLDKIIVRPAVRFVGVSLKLRDILTPVEIVGRLFPGYVLPEFIQVFRRDILDAGNSTATIPLAHSTESFLNSCFGDRFRRRRCVQKTPHLIGGKNKQTVVDGFAGKIEEILPDENIWKRCGGKRITSGTKMHRYFVFVLEQDSGGRR